MWSLWRLVWTLMDNLPSLTQLAHPSYRPMPQVRVPRTNGNDNTWRTLHGGPIEQTRVGFEAGRRIALLTFTAAWIDTCTLYLFGVFVGAYSGNFNQASIALLDNDGERVGFVFAAYAVYLLGYGTAHVLLREGAGPGRAAFVNFVVATTVFLADVIANALYPGDAGGLSRSSRASPRSSCLRSSTKSWAAATVGRSWRWCDGCGWSPPTWRVPRPRRRGSCESRWRAGHWRSPRGWSS